MSVLSILVPVVIAAIAAALYAIVAGAWAWRSFAAMWLFGLALLLLPLVIRP